MATTVNALCYKSKTLSNGEHPLMICVCKDGKRKYKSLGVSVKAEHWNFEKNLPKTNCPNKEYINILIANKRKEYETDIDVAWLKRYEAWLRSSKLEENTIGIRFRTFRNGIAISTDFSDIIYNLC